MKTLTRILSLAVILAILSLSLCGCFDSGSGDPAYRYNAPDDYTTTTTTLPAYAYSATAPTYTYATAPTYTYATVPTYTYTTQPTTSYTINVPDLTGTDAESAKTLLVNCGLVPVIADEFCDFITQGLVTRSEPSAFTEVPRGTRVTVYVSRGQSSMRASNFQYTWQNKVSDSPASAQVEQVFVEGDTLYLDFNYRMEYYTSEYQSVMNYNQKYLHFDSFNVDIDGNIIAASASGDAANGFVEHANQNVVYRMRLQIPLTPTVTHRPQEIKVYCKIHIKQIWANGIGRTGEGAHTYDYKFSAHHITW